MPCVAVASRHRLHASTAVVEGEVERHRAVATGSVGHCMGSDVVGSSVSVTVNPSVTVAAVLVIDTCVAVADGKVQCHHTVTTCDGR